MFNEFGVPCPKIGVVNEIKAFIRVVSSGVVDSELFCKGL
jgi:hypothetical protein